MLAHYTAVHIASYIKMEIAMSIFSPTVDPKSGYGQMERLKQPDHYVGIAPENIRQEIERVYKAFENEGVNAHLDPKLNEEIEKLGRSLYLKAAEEGLNHLKAKQHELSIQEIGDVHKWILQDYKAAGVDIMQQPGKMAELVRAETAAVLSAQGRGESVELQGLVSAEIGGGKIRLDVRSGGCTKIENFGFVVEQGPGNTQQVTVVHFGEPDVCKGNFPAGVHYEFSRDALALRPGAVTFTNLGDSPAPQ